MRRCLGALLACAFVVCTLFAQKPFREYPAWEYHHYKLPEDYQAPGEFTFARLMYPTYRIAIDWQFRPQFDWRSGHTNWSIDYPRSDRHLPPALRRLTRVSARSVEQPINLEEDDDVFNYPWLYAVETGHWELTPQQIAKFREFLLRGGFFMCDDFHGAVEWDVFMATLRKVFPDRPVVDLDKRDSIFHAVFNLDERYQVPGAQFLRSQTVCEKCEAGGLGARWRGIYDDNGRLMVAICHNVDLGDSWEHADDPRYPAKFSELGLQIGVNYVVYAMTH
jgi:hypothetical protein